MNRSSFSLPPGVRVFERGWLSANNILFESKGATALVDTGYATHSAQTVSLVRSALEGKSLDWVLNTHLHSDHCGGNAALQRAYPGVRTLIPPGLATAVTDWDTVALTYAPTGQICPRFHFEALLRAGDEIDLGAARWEIHGAPGHDPHSIILFEPASRTLISADALWQNGFGIVFAELEGGQAFDEVAATLDVIESLAPRVVIPGHGAVFIGVETALSAARSKLEFFVREPRKHARHAAKVLLKFKMLEAQQLHVADLTRWASGTPYFQMVHARFFADVEFGDWISDLLSDLARSGAARVEGETVSNA